MRVAEPVFRAHLQLPGRPSSRSASSARRAHRARAQAPRRAAGRAEAALPGRRRGLPRHRRASAGGHRRRGRALPFDARRAKSACALLTTPGAGKWYRSAGPWASQQLDFEVDGAARVAAAGDDRLRRRAGRSLDRGAPRPPMRATSAGRSSAWAAPARASASSAADAAEHQDPARRQAALARARPHRGGGHAAAIAGGPGRAHRLRHAHRCGAATLADEWRACERARGPRGDAAAGPAGRALPRRLERSSARLFRRACGRALRPALLGREAHAPRIWST